MLHKGSQWRHKPHYNHSNKSGLHEKVFLELHVCESAAVTGVMQANAAYVVGGVE